MVDMHIYIHILLRHWDSGAVYLLLSCGVFQRVQSTAHLTTASAYSKLQTQLA